MRTTILVIVQGKIRHVDRGGGSGGGVNRFLGFITFSYSTKLVRVNDFALVDRILVGLSFFRNLVRDGTAFTGVVRGRCNPVCLVTLVLSII